MRGANESSQKVKKMLHCTRGREKVEIDYAAMLSPLLPGVRETVTFGKKHNVQGDVLNNDMIPYRKLRMRKYENMLFDETVLQAAVVTSRVKPTTT